MNFLINNKKTFSFLLFVLMAFFSFSLAIAANETTNLNLSSEYNDNPSTNSNFQIVPKCAENGSVKCGWTELLQLVRNIMSLLLFLSASIAVLSFMYAGFLYLTAFGDMGKVEQAHSIFSKVMIGFLFVFLGWLIVATILKIMGVEEGFYLLNTGQVNTNGVNDSSSWW